MNIPFSGTTQATFILILATALCCSSEVNKVPKNIDHLVYTASSLEKGMDEIEALTGVRPVPGGRHPDYGTHNAILSIGESTYLEIIAPDPDLARPQRGRLFENCYQERSKLTTWVLRSGNIEELHDQAVSNGLMLGAIESGQRQKPDGTILSWRFTNPYALPLDGVIPYLINWGDSPHPSGAAPRAGELIAFIIEHPKAEQITRNLRLLGVNADVQKAEKVRLIARIRTEKNGIVTLE